MSRFISNVTCFNVPCTNDCSVKPKIKKSFGRILKLQSEYTLCSSWTYLPIIIDLKQFEKKPQAAPTHNVVKSGGEFRGNYGLPKMQTESLNQNALNSK